MSHVLSQGLLQHMPYLLRLSTVLLPAVLQGAAEENYNEAIIHALGMDRRNEVLGRLYMCR